jgi:hypothetical protein
MPPQTIRTLPSSEPRVSCSEVIGLWLIRPLIRALTGRTAVVAWQQVAAVSAEEVTLEVLAAQLSDLDGDPGQ